MKREIEKTEHRENETWRQETLKGKQDTEEREPQRHETGNTNTRHRETIDKRQEKREGNSEKERIGQSSRMPDEAEAEQSGP